MFTSILKSGSDSVTIAKRLEDNLLFESEFVDNTQELDTAEGDAYNSIKEVRVEEIFGTSFGAISSAVPRAMSRKTSIVVSRAVSIGIHIAISRVVFEAIMKVKT